MASSASWLATLAVLAALGIGAQGCAGRGTQRPRPPTKGRKGFGDGGQEFGYVDVREGAHMFYWLFYVCGGDSAAGKPLVIWLQGGPGGSSTSFGNFMEIGPLDAHLRKRNSSWVDHVNVLFIDNPVGAGYSYVDDSSKLATNNKEIADDLVAFTKTFMIKYPQFQSVPLYVFSESYGGKMTAEFALNLYRAQRAGQVASRLKAVGLVDSSISPIDMVMSWAPYALSTGLVDSRGYAKIEEAALATKKAVDAGHWLEAIEGRWHAGYVVYTETGYVNLYNILKPIRKDSAGDQLDGDVDLNDLMDRQVKPALGVIPDKVHHLYHGNQDVSNALRYDRMKPVTGIVEQLLNDTDVEVAVLSGQLDLLVDTPGTVAWVERLRWPLAEHWRNTAPREELVVDGVVEGFVKRAGAFSFYWVLRSGHMIPSDNPAAALEIMKTVTGLKNTVPTIC